MQENEHVTISKPIPSEISRHVGVSEMKLPSILFASVMTLPLLVVASQNDSTWGKDLGPINDFMLNPTDENAAKNASTPVEPSTVMINTTSIAIQGRPLRPHA
jgi:hypothetical protein